MGGVSGKRFYLFKRFYLLEGHFSRPIMTPQEARFTKEINAILQCPVGPKLDAISQLVFFDEYDCVSAPNRDPTRPAGQVIEIARRNESLPGSRSAPTVTQAKRPFSMQIQCFSLPTGWVPVGRRMTVENLRLRFDVTVTHPKKTAAYEFRPLRGE